jgi:DNA-binding winged helix-turn-helix (wHTH) protein
MESAPHFLFPPFHLDPVNERLWHNSRLLPLRPKAFAVLWYLVEHPQRLVTRAELLRAVWPGTYVSEGLLRGYIRDLRRALGDDAEGPRFIETVARRGYRFIAPVTPAPPVRSPQSKLPTSP